VTTLPSASEALPGVVSDARTIYTDLDGTMLGRGGAFTRGPDGSPAVAPAEALVGAHRGGIEIVPCSGRAHRGLISDGRILGLATVIADMGAVLSYETGRELIFNLGAYPGGDATPVAAMERAGAVELLLSRYAGRLELHSPWAANREYTQLFRGRIDLEDANAALETSGAGWAHLVDNGKLSARYLDLPEGDVHVYHLLPRGVSKGTAIAMDRERRGIERRACIAIGDAVADLEIAAEVAALVLVRDAVDAHPELAQRAAGLGNVFVTEAPGNLGWAETVSSIVRAAR
jgi:predicted mannosyl-3-phosphoglycerate phosphatase (HAD superfamily)